MQVTHSTQQPAIEGWGVRERGTYSACHAEGTHAVRHIGAGRALIAFCARLSHAIIQAGQARAHIAPATCNRRVILEIEAPRGGPASVTLNTLPVRLWRATNKLVESRRARGVTWKFLEVLLRCTSSAECTTTRRRRIYTASVFYTIRTEGPSWHTSYTRLFCTEIGAIRTGPTVFGIIPRGTTLNRHRGTPPTWIFCT